MKLGRNEPCHCGSGKKYKHCHWDADRAAESKELEEQAAARLAERADTEEEAPDASSETHGGNGPKQNGKDGSRFMRESVKSGRAGKPSGGAGTSRISRGSQRGS